ncbi:MAG: LysR family transcriptional regulator [Alphaproteobacteria bacterium]|nr:MAG: LysR family transcriptional regulator [Alphaproteobacteria bacterium]
MDLRQLRYFVEITDQGSFSKASRALSIAQPALSRQIKMLEEELGTPLYYRNGRGVEMTTAGELFLVHARVVLERIHQATREITSLHGMPRGVVTLGLPPSVSSVVLSALTMTLAERYPLIKLRVEEGFSGNVAEWLQSGKVDIAIVYEDRSTASFIFEKLLTEHLMLVHHPSMKVPETVTAETLAPIPLALPMSNHGLRRLVESGLAAYGYRPTVKFELDSLLVLKDLAIRGAAATILPYGSVASEVEGGLLKVTPVTKPWLTRVMVLAMANGRPLDATHRAVVRVIRDLATAYGREHPLPTMTPPLGEF